MKASLDLSDLTFMQSNLTFMQLHRKKIKNCRIKLIPAVFLNSVFCFLLPCPARVKSDGDFRDIRNVIEGETSDFPSQPRGSGCGSPPHAHS